MKGSKGKRWMDSLLRKQAADHSAHNNNSNREPSSRRIHKNGDGLHRAGGFGYRQGHCS